MAVVAAGAIGTAAAQVDGNVTTGNATGGSGTSGAAGSGAANATSGDATATVQQNNNTISFTNTQFGYASASSGSSTTLPDNADDGMTDSGTMSDDSGTGMDGASYPSWCMSDGKHDGRDGHGGDGRDGNHGDNEVVNVDATATVNQSQANTQTVTFIGNATAQSGDANATSGDATSGNATGGDATSGNIGVDVNATVDGVVDGTRP